MVLRCCATVENKSFISRQRVASRGAPPHEKEKFMPRTLSGLIVGTLVAASFCFGITGSRAQQVATGKNSPNFPIEIVPSTMNGWSKPSFTADGRFAVIGNGNGAQVWDLEKNRLVRTFVGLTTINTAVALSPDGLR